jgi:hypothetical protein
MELDSQRLSELIEQGYREGSTNGESEGSTGDTLLSVLLTDTIEQAKRITVVEDNVKSVERDIQGIEVDLKDIKASYSETQEKRSAIVEKILWIVAGALIPTLITLLFNK